MKPLSTLLQSIPPSVTLAVNDKAKALQRAGHDVIILAGGDPDFATPPHIVEAAWEAIHHKSGTHYPAPMKGIVPALEAIATKMAQDNGVDLDPMANIVITPGGKWALFLALSAILNPGDEVLILEPHWVSYPHMVRLAGGTAVSVSLPADDNFTVTAERLRPHLSPHTKAIMINTPCNPTGRVFTRAEVEAVAEVAQEADLFVISDEIYEKLVFDGRSHISLASLPGMVERTLTINGLSKSYAMTGWRMGWLAAPAPIIKLASTMNGQTVSAAAHLTMHALVAALTGPQAAIAEMRAAYQARRDFMVRELNAMPGVACRSIEGTFYLFPSFPRSGKTSVELADSLLEKAGIAATPGAAFGASGEGHVRFAISTAMSELERAVARLAPVSDQI